MIRQVIRHAVRLPWDRSILTLLVLAFLVASSVGCVRRRLTVRSNPTGALVYVDNQQIGATPCSVDFTYYGTREIRLVKPGFETLTVNQPIPTPWYQIPPLDFVSENLMPTRIRDNRNVTYNLAPQMIVPTQQLIERGQELRQGTLQGTAVPGTSLPAGAPPGILGPPTTLPAPSGGTPTPILPAPPTTTDPFGQSQLEPAPAVAPAPQESGPRIVSPPLR